MKGKDSNQSDFDKATELLRVFVDWWDTWVLSNNPTEISDPPIEEIKKFLLEKDSSINR